MIRTLRLIRWAMLSAIVLLAIGVAVLEFSPGSGPAIGDVSEGTVAIPAGVSIGGPFHLIDDKGRAVSEADYRGRWLLVFFGYSNCPDECPLTLQKMAAARMRARTDARAEPALRECATSSSPTSGSAAASRCRRGISGRLG